MAIIASAPGPMPSRSSATARGWEALRVVELIEEEEEPEESYRLGHHVNRDADAVSGSL